MRPIIDSRNPALWRDMPPEDIWRRYRAAMSRTIRHVFNDARARPIVAVREGFAPPAPGDRA